MILWATAIGGAGPIISSLGYIWPDRLGFLRHPQAGVQQVTSTLIWVALAAAGWITQRGLFPRCGSSGLAGPRAGSVAFEVPSDDSGSPAYQI